MGKKRILLFPHEEQHKLYRKPWEVLSMVNFEKYYDSEKNKLDYKSFPALRLAKGYELILDHGETLFMPAGYWHHMEYIDSGFAVSLQGASTRNQWKNKRSLESFWHAPSRYAYEKNSTWLVV